MINVFKIKFIFVFIFLSVFFVSCKAEAKINFLKIKINDEVKTQIYEAQKKDNCAFLIFTFYCEEKANVKIGFINDKKEKK
ncbi:MAG: hypothetical protein GX220_07435 [Treponema sp.]|nr:hypothetical protein [Treponema sp.]